MATYKSYHSYLINSLKDPSEAAAYLDAVLEDGDLEHILLALKNVAEAKGDFGGASSELASAQENHHPEMGQQETLSLSAIATLLDELGLRLSVTVKQEPAA
jgi:DNA-binding phage protein